METVTPMSAQLCWTNLCQQWEKSKCTELYYRVSCFPWLLVKVSFVASCSHSLHNRWHILSNTTDQNKDQNFPIFIFHLLNIQLFSYNHWVGIKISRCIHKKTQRHRASVKHCPPLCFFLFISCYKGERRGVVPHAARFKRRLLAQQLNTCQTTNTFIVMRKVDFWKRLLILKCLGAKICVETVNRLHSSKVFITSPPPPEFIFKFQQYSLLEAFEIFLPQTDFGSRESWRHRVCVYSTDVVWKLTLCKEWFDQVVYH